MKGRDQVYMGENKRGTKKKLKGKKTFTEPDQTPSVILIQILPPA